MIKFLQLFVTLLDCIILFGLLCLLLLVITNFIEQFYIRMRCRYRGIGEKPGRACVICDYQRRCDRVWKSEEYTQYSRYKGADSDQAKKLFNEILEEEKAKKSNAKHK